MEAKKDPDQIGTRDVSKGINFYSIEKEMALGKQLAQEVERHSKLVTDKLITEYVNRMGQNLARHSDTKIPLTVKVVEGDDPNAITLPGGFIYVQTGCSGRRTRKPNWRRRWLTKSPMSRRAMARVRRLVAGMTQIVDDSTHFYGRMGGTLRARRGASWPPPWLFGAQSGNEVGGRSAGPPVPL